MDSQDDQMFNDIDINAVTNSETIRQLESKIDVCMRKLTGLREFVNNNVRIVANDLNEIRTSIGQLKKPRFETDNNCINNGVFVKEERIEVPDEQEVQEGKYFCAEPSFVNVNGQSYVEVPCIPEPTINQDLPGPSFKADNNIDNDDPADNLASDQETEDESNHDVEESQENSSEYKPSIESQMQCESESSVIIMEKLKNGQFINRDWMKDGLSLIDEMLEFIKSTPGYSSNSNEEKVYFEIHSIKEALMERGLSTPKMLVYEVGRSLKNLDICANLVEELKALYENRGREIFPKYYPSGAPSLPKTYTNPSTSKARNADDSDSEYTPASKKSKPNQKKNKAVINQDESSGDETDDEINNRMSTSRGRNVIKSDDEDSKDSISSKSTDEEKCDANVQGGSNNVQNGSVGSPKKTVKDKPNSPDLTPAEYMHSVKPNQMINKEIIGKVKAVTDPELPNHNLLNIILECGGKVLVKIKAWGNEKIKIKDKIKKNQTLSFQNIYAYKNQGDPTYDQFHEGTVSYELTVRQNTIIRRWIRTGKWEFIKI